MMLASMGISPEALGCAVLGSMAGMAATESISRWRAMVVLVGSLFVSALCAQLIARAWFGGDELWRNWIAMGIGMFYPAIKARLIIAVPSIIDWMLHRAGIGKKASGGTE